MIDEALVLLTRRMTQAFIAALDDADLPAAVYMDLCRHLGDQLRVIELELAL